MKFGELKIGAVFILDGEKYVKTSPMIGLCEKTGAQKFMRRSIEVDVSDSTATAKSAVKKRSLSHSEVLEAFSGFYAQCERCLQQLVPQANKQLVHSVQEQLEEAKQRFLEKIK